MNVLPPTAFVSFQAPASLPALANGSPAVFVLLKEGCPCTLECRTQLNVLADACRGKIRFAGIVDADVRQAGELAKKAELRFSVLPDPKRSWIRSLDGREGLDLRLVGKDGRVVAKWNALNRENVAALIGAVRRETGRDVSLSLDPFTILPKIGCSF